MKNDPNLANVRATVARALERLEPLFVADARLTFIMRLPGNDDATLIVTSDMAGDIVKALDHLIAEGRA